MTMKKIILTALSFMLAILFASCTFTLPSGKSSSEDSATSEPAYLFQASEETASAFYNAPKSGDGDIVGTYVSQDDLPGIFSADEISGAIKVSHHSTNYVNFDKLYIKFDYTVSELEALKSTYKSAQFKIYFEIPPVSGASIIYQRGGKHMISYVESFNSGWSANQVHRNTWNTFEIPLDSLIASMQTEETASSDDVAYVFAGNCTDGHSQLDVTMNVYIADFVLIEKLGA